MIDNQVTLEVLLRGVIPFGSANIFLMVLIYFSLVRYRIGITYPFYAAFIVCFILFLLGPLVNLTSIEEGKYWYDIFRNVLLFSVGIPSLFIGLLHQAGHQVSHKIILTPYLLGLAWALLFMMAPPIRQYELVEMPWLVNLSWLKPQYIYLSQILLIIILLVIPSIVLLAKKPSRYVAMQIYGVLVLCLFMCIGNAFQQWELYYAGASLTALVWGGAVFYDIQLTNEKIKQHNRHQSLLAKAQFTAPKLSNFTEFYPNKLNEAYPFKERELLIEALRTLSYGLIDKSVSRLLMELRTFTQNNIDIYKVRAKEVLFMLFDSVIYQSGHAQQLLSRLELKGEELEQATTIDEIDNIIRSDAHFLVTLPIENNESEEINALVDRIKTYILANYNKDISIKDIVFAVGASRSHVMKIFKEVTTQTINQYIVDVRINKAKTFLLSMSITEAAFEVGFSSSAYFSTVFKKQTELTPKEYQLRAKQKKL